MKIITGPSINKQHKNCLYLEMKNFRIVDYVLKLLVIISPKQPGVSSYNIHTMVYHQTGHMHPPPVILFMRTERWNKDQYYGSMWF